ncbi:abortive infection system antitoxin AbiGi family protein [Vibrio splendidus]|uniref:abortive infection system antitoxin AbiGi family protein n=1 Tax=Vibrio splendidus TaxID=29497 RepID=UPI000C85F265|nr:abortive infection system antitoxin AbiGi family protein [Vibrio splendidus]PMI28664.1 hypothetical protein BCU48_14995 [Vibrio splendidus]
MKPKSSTLFHFTKNTTFVKNILREGFWPRYCLEDITWYGPAAGYLAYPMVCFCDIPLSRIRDHVNFYGNYGIGVTKEWARKNKLNPITYLSNASWFSDAINKLYLNCRGQNYKQYYTGSDVDLDMIMAHFKPIEGAMVINNNPITKEFYQENEWRYVPSNPNINRWLTEVLFREQNTLETENNKTKMHCSLKIAPQDIRYIFVKSEADIPDMVNFIQTELDYYPSSDVKILISKIVSLDSLTEDI